MTDCPEHMGFSYPANAGWRLWALAKARQPKTILDDLRTRWANMESVKLNKTLSENWTVRSDTPSQWSHCPVAPLYVLYMNIAGIKPLTPGFATCQIKPQLADLQSLSLITRTVRGNLTFTADGKLPNRNITITTPKGCTAQLMVNKKENLNLQKHPKNNSEDLICYILPAGQASSFTLKYT